MLTLTKRFTANSQRPHGILSSPLPAIGCFLLDRAVVVVFFFLTRHSQFLKSLNPAL